MEVTETDNKETDQLSASSLAFSYDTEVAETEDKKSCEQTVDDSASIGHLGLISKQEYEAQFFGFTPKSFSDGCK